jgi:hypothetical protein
VKADIVCNSGPLIALAIIQRLDLLRATFGRVIVPDLIRREILTGGSTGAGLAAIRECAWLEVLPLASSPDPLLTATLDVGEAAVIALARDLGVGTVLMDERKGRKIARTVFGLRVIGTARVLAEAKLAGLIPSARAALLQLKQAGYWLDDRIIEESCRVAGE